MNPQPCAVEVVSLGAHQVRDVVDTGQFRDLAEVARRGHVTGAGMTPITDVLFLFKSQLVCDYLGRLLQPGRQPAEAAAVGPFSTLIHRLRWVRFTC